MKKEIGSSKPKKGWGMKWGRLLLCGLLVITMIPNQKWIIRGEDPLSTPTTLRVATWNIAAKNHPDVAVMSQKMQQLNLEVVGVQEVDMFNKRNDYDMMEAFVSKTYPYVHFAKGRDYEGGDFGIGIVSQLPLLQAASHPLNTTGSSATKTCERVVIEKQDKEIAIYNVHLSVESRALRQLQINQILHRIENDEVPYKIILGDFNSDQDYYEYSRFLEYFDLANGQDGKWMDTYNRDDDANMKVLAVDNILVSKNIKIEDVQVSRDSTMSDHDMLVADLTLLNETTGGTTRHNIALGNTIAVDSIKENTSEKALVDFDLNSGWEAEKESATINLSLDSFYEVDSLALIWPKNYFGQIEISGKQTDGTWKNLGTMKVHEAGTTKMSVEKSTVNQLRFQLSAPQSSYSGLNEIQVFGLKVQVDQDGVADGKNWIANGNFEETQEAPTTQLGPANTWWDVNVWDKNVKAKDWIFQVYKGTKENHLAYEGSLDTLDKVEGAQCLKVNKSDNTTAQQAFIKQLNVPIDPNKTYVVTLKAKMKNCTDDKIVLSVTQRDSQQKELGSSLSVNLTNTEDWSEVRQEITTLAKTTKLDVVLKNTGNEGTLWLDDVKIIDKLALGKEIFADTLKIETTKRILQLRETVQLQALTSPLKAKDSEVKWTSSNGKVAQVNQQGLVMANGRGFATITATSIESPRLNSSITIQVLQDNKDTTKLKATLDLALQRNEQDFTQKSWANYWFNVESAQAILKKDNSTQEELDQALANLLASQSVLIAKDTADTNMYTQMRQYWVQEMVGVDSQFHDEKLKNSVQELDGKAESYFNTMNELTTPNLQTLWSDEELLANKNGAEVTVMLDRLKMMAIQTQNPNSKFYQDEKAIQKTMDALAFTVRVRYNAKSGSTGNWWDGEIGTPKALVDCVLIYYDQFALNNPELLSRVCSAVDAHIPNADRRGTSATGLKETGANLIDKVAIVLKRSLLDQNHERLVHSQQKMSPLFELVKTSDGFYQDGSFVFHNNIAYNGSYGAVLIDELVNCIAMLSYSDVALGKKEISFVEQQIVNAYFPFITNGGNIVDSVRGRAIARMGQQGDTMGARVMGTLLQYADIADEEMKQIIQARMKLALEQKYAQSTTQSYSDLSYSDITRLLKLLSSDVTCAPQQDSYRQFAAMNKAVASRKDYTFALSMSSHKIYNTEMGNTENTRGYYQGQGMSQLYGRDVNQFNLDYWATVDPFRLPGVTTGHQLLANQTTGQDKWAGGSTLDKIRGVSGQVISANKTLENKSKSGVSANKSWFVLDNRIVAIGSAINNTNSQVDEVETIIDNRKIGTTGIISDIQGTILENSGTSNEKAFLIQNDQETMGYIILDDNAVTYKKETREGKWYDINQLGKFTDHTLKTNTFGSLSISHGQKPTNSTYQVMTVPNTTKEELALIQADPQVAVIALKDNVHALKDLVTNQEYYNFFQPETAGDIRVNAPVSLTMSRDSKAIQLAVADPSQTSTSVQITLDNFKVENADIISGNATIIEKTDHSVTIEVNFDSKDGMSQVVELAAKFAVVSDNLALNKQVTASSVVNNANTQNRQPKYIVDGDTKTTCWSSEYLTDGKVDASYDKSWIMVDLGEVKEINQVLLSWNTGRAKKYEIQVSQTQEGSFKTVYQFNDESSDNAIKNKTRVDTLNFEPVLARYVKMQGIERSSQAWTGNDTYRAGYVLFEMEVFNSTSIRTSIAQGQQLMTTFNQSVLQLSNEEYEKIAKPLVEALQNAQEWMTSSEQGDEQQLQALNNQIQQAQQRYQQAITHVRSVSVDCLDYSLIKGDHLVLKPRFEPENASLKQVKLTSSDESVITIEKDGSIRAAKKGEATITIMAIDGNSTATIHFVVTTAPQRVTFNETYLLLKKGETSQLHATVLPTDASVNNLVWTSSDDSIVSVDQLGHISCLRKGTATIFATLENTELKGECKIDVELDFSATSPNFALNQEVQVSSVVAKTPGGLVNEDRLGNKAVDGLFDTRWASEYRTENDQVDASFDDGWITINLGEARTINKVILTWESSNAKKYTMQGSIDGVTYFDLTQFDTEDLSRGERKDELVFQPTLVQYVKMQGLDRSSNYNNNSRGGYSLYELEVIKTTDYYALMKQAKECLEAYPLKQQVEYLDLKTSVDAVDQFVNSQAYDSSLLYDMLLDIETKTKQLLTTFIRVTNISVSPTETSVLPGQIIEATITIEPEDALNKNSRWISSDETVVKVEPEGLLAVNPGTAQLQVISEDGNYEAELVVTVRTNQLPIIHAENITISLNNAFDVLQGVSGKDAEDGNLKVQVMDNPLDVNTPGVYQVVYQVKDSDDNQVTQTRSITVVYDSHSNSTVSKNGVTVTGPIPYGSTLQIEDQTSQDKLVEKLQSQFNKTVLQVIHLSLTKELTLTPQFDYTIVMPTMEGYGNYEVYLIHENEVTRLNPIFTNQTMQLISSYLGQVVVTATKDEVIPPPNLDYNGNKEQETQPDKKVETTKTSNKSRATTFPLATDQPAVSKEQIKEKEPETACQSSDCNENQPAQETPTAMSQSTNSIGSVIAWIGGAIAVLALARLILEKKKKAQN